MALIDSISTILGFGGTKPANRAGISASEDIHVQGGSHAASHTELELKAQPKKYTDNLPG
jgi:hypothetical protein